MKRTILVFLSFWLGTIAWAFNQAHFDRLMQTKRCLECDLSDLNLRNENLKGAVLGDSNLQRANLWDVDLQIAFLQRVNFQKSYLQGAKLMGADLQNANYRGPIFRGRTLMVPSWKEQNLPGRSC